MPGMGPTMHEFSEGDLKSSSGQKVTNRKQAIAIGLSEERRAGKPTQPPRKKHPLRGRGSRVDKA